MGTAKWQPNQFYRVLVTRSLPTPPLSQARAALAAANPAPAAAEPVAADAASAKSPPASGQKREREGAEGAVENKKERKVAPSQKTKWKKLASAELARKGGSTKLKSLVAAVLAAAGKGEDAGEELMKKLTSSSRFKLEGKRITLVEEA